MPTAVVERLREELPDFRGTGTTVMEVSHRGSDFVAFAEELEAIWRRVLVIPDAYHVGFLHGGASSQFALIPLNLGAAPQSVARYRCDGHWGNKAFREAGLLTQAARWEDWNVDAPASYCHYTSNETIEGLQFRDPVAGSNVICDMSSDILSRPIAVADFGMIYAGAQKNAGIAGTTIVIIEPGLLHRMRPDLPTMLSYRKQLAADSMANTPCTIAWYVSRLVLDWIEGEGGLAVMEHRARQKADLLYQVIDSSALYHNGVDSEVRSYMNVVAELPGADLTARFVREAQEQGMVGLKGHRAVGGIRASLYNAVSMRSVEALAEFMQEFERRA